MGFLFKVQEEMEGQMAHYFDSIGDIVQKYRMAVGLYFNNDPEGFEKIAYEIIALKKRMAKVREKLILTMYEKSLVPDSREDITQLLGVLDEIPKRVVKQINVILREAIVFPQEIHGEMRNLFKQLQIEIETVMAACHAFFKDLNSVQALSNDVMNQEAAADVLEFEALKKVFSMDLDLGHKLHLKAFIRRIALLADMGEEAAQYLLIFATKRRI
ncbi:DUF47 family protein [Deltaproteobacteria bacterium TL4]